MEPLLQANNQELYDIGANLFAAQKRQVRHSLRELVLTNGSLDGAALQAQWFPLVEADVFISHSHTDAETVVILAGLLRKFFGISCFTDTTVWGYGATLLRKLDGEHCTNGPDSYSYEARNLSTSHVYLMLAGALSKMIDRTECVFFLNSPASVEPGLVMNATLSPWLYFEVLSTQLVRKRQPSDHLARQQTIQKSFSDTGEKLITEALTMTHQIELGHLTPLHLSAAFFRRWLAQAAGYQFRLDALYRLCPQSTTYV